MEPSSTSSPRRLTAYDTTTSDDGSASSSGGGGGDVSNPYDDEVTHQNRHNQQHNTTNYHYSVAFGTERGSLHYRNYPPAEPRIIIFLVDVASTAEEVHIIQLIMKEVCSKVEVEVIHLN